MGRIKQFFMRLFGPSEKDAIRNKVLIETVDFDNVVSSSLLAKGLYDELKKVCHPDRFHNEQDENKANELFQLITQNKGDYNKLLALKDQVYSELPIDIND